MSALGIRRSTHRLRRHAAGLLLALTVSAAIAVHHTAVPMDGMDDHHGLSATVELCLGVLTAVGTAVVAVAIGLLALGRWATPIALLPTGTLTLAGARAPKARAGPPPPALLCVWRR